MQCSKARLWFPWIFLAFITIAGMLTFFCTLSRYREGGVTGAKTRVRLAQRELMISEKFVQKFDQTNSPTFHVLGDKLVAGARRQNVSAQIGLVVAEEGEHLNAVATNYVERFQEFNAVQEAMAKLELASIRDVLVRPNRSRDRSRGYYEIYTGTNSARAVTALQSTGIARVITSDDPFIAVRMREILQTNGIRSSLRPMKLPGQTDEPEGFVVFVARSDESVARSILRK
jgi:hypothetical protein